MTEAILCPLLVGLDVPPQRSPQFRSCFLFPSSSLRVSPKRLRGVIRRDMTRKLPNRDRQTSLTVAEQGIKQKPLAVLQVRVRVLDYSALVLYLSAAQSRFRQSDASLAAVDWSGRFGATEGTYIVRRAPKNDSAPEGTDP